MASLSKSPGGLNVLTIDGGCLEGVAPLVILHSLLDTFAQERSLEAAKVHPCDVFDLICGIGSGGWLALMLGRFRMDIPTALEEWEALLNGITPSTHDKMALMQLVQNRCYKLERLVHKVEELAGRYKTGVYMHMPNSDGIRCSHVFVAVVNAEPRKDGSKQYHLLRTYQTTEKYGGSAEYDEHHWKLANAFAATGAMKAFTGPWEERLDGKTKLKFFDDQFPHPHNISELAVDEVYALYGKKTPISVVVNIGPGMPRPADVKLITHRFSLNDHVFNKEEKQKTFLNEGRVLEEQVVRKLQNMYGADESLYYRLAPVNAEEFRGFGDSSRVERVTKQTNIWLSHGEVKAKVHEVSTQLTYSGTLS